MMSYCEMLLLKSNHCLKRNDLRCNNHSDISLETRDQVSKLGAFVGYSNENSVQLCLNNTFFLGYSFKGRHPFFLHHLLDYLGVV